MTLRERFSSRRRRMVRADAQLRYWQAEHARDHKAKAPVAERRHDHRMIEARERDVRKYRRLTRAALRSLQRAVRPLRVKALREAEALVGVMEHGGNNRGSTVEAIIRYAQGSVPEPWCVDFNIWCYGHAGSEVVKPGYPRAVRYMDTAGVHRTSEPKAGDMVRFTFDHTGLFVRDLGNGYIETIEGNTGASGAVSDSSTGEDGVYRKRRPKSQVADYLRVER